MYKYKIGDHVIVEEDNLGGYYAGKTGVIDDIWPEPHAYQYRVSFDHDKHLRIWCKVKSLVDESRDIKRVIFNDPATVIIWKDGTKTVAKAVKGDKYDPEKGFAIAYAKKFGGKTFREEMEKWCESIKPVAEVTLDGFKVGDRVSFNGHMGTVVCIGIMGSLGVKMDEKDMGYHDCDGYKLTAGDYPTGMCSRWLKPSLIKHVDENKPLTIEELEKMDGKRVWLSRFTEGVEKFDITFCEWHTVDVKHRKLFSKSGFDDFCNMNHPYGFRAYLTPQTGKH